MSVGVVGLLGAVLIGVGAVRYRLSPARNFPEVLGQYKKLGSKRFRTADGLRVHCVYPVVSEGDRAEYTPHSHVRGIGQAYSSRMLEAVLPLLLSRQSQPNIESGKVVDAKLPLVVFSHGLYGSADMYTQLCREIASFGTVVVTLDHKDGTSTAGEVEYKRPPADLQYSDREAVRRFRRPFLEVRQTELAAVMRFIDEMASEGDPLFQAIDTSRLVLAGHSFGAAHTLANAERIGRRVKCTLLYDLWAKPVPEETQPNDKTLSILSSAFAEGPEGEPTRAFSIPHSYYLRNTTHTLWSDFSWIFPHWANPLVAYRDPTEAHKAWVRATHAFLDHHLNDKEGSPILPDHPQLVRLE